MPDLVPFEVVRFKTVTKRSYREPGEKASTFINYKARTGKEFFGILLGVLDSKENIPVNEEVIDQINNHGWFSGEQLVAYFGKEKAQAFGDSLEAEYEKRQKATALPTPPPKKAKRTTATKRA